MHQQPQPYDAVLGGSDQQTPCYEYLLPTDFDAERLSELVRGKRGKRGYKDTSRETGIRIAAIYQAEIAHINNQSFPTHIHFEDFLALCKWLDVPPAELVLTSTLQKILATCGGPEPRPYDAVLGSAGGHPRR